jgi:hypothetical protein
MPARPWMFCQCNHAQHGSTAGFVLAAAFIPIHRNAAAFLAFAGHTIQKREHEAPAVQKSFLELAAARVSYAFSRAIPRSTRNTAATTIAAANNTFNETCSAASHQPSSTATIGLI